VTSGGRGTPDHHDLGTDHHTERKIAVQHTRIAFYDHVSGDYDDLAHQAETGMGAILRAEPGFLSYSIGRDTDGRIVATSDWETREQADQAMGTAASWIRDNMADHVHLINAHVVDFTFTVTP
jgi:quinol monooxygenase YgiN